MPYKDGIHRGFHDPRLDLSAPTGDRFTENVRHSNGTLHFHDALHRDSHHRAHHSHKPKNQWSSRPVPEYSLPRKSPAIQRLSLLHFGSRSGLATPASMSLPPTSDRPNESTRSTVSRPVINGTDFRTGINSHDSAFPQLLYHSDHTSTAPQRKAVNPKKNYKVLYVPELDKSLSSLEKKTTAKKTRFHGDGIHKVVDPRKANVAQYFQKPNKQSKKFPFKQIPRSRFIFDKDSIGPPPQNELVLWDLPLTISEVYLSNFLNGYGDPIKDMKFHNDPINAVPLGIATFKFHGNLEKAVRLAKGVIEKVKLDHTKIDGHALKIGLNDHRNEFLSLKIIIAQERLEAVRQKNSREEEEKQRARLRMEIASKKSEQANLQARDLADDAPKTIPKQADGPKYQPGTTTLSRKHNGKVVPGVFLPPDLNKYIKDRSYLLIYKKYVPTRPNMASSIKQKLENYNWTRVLADEEGYFIVFNSILECVRCFTNEDGSTLSEYRMHMELAVPPKFRPAADENYNTSTDVKKHTDVVNEAKNLLIKEFQSFLTKDIRERVIAPVILDLLSVEKYPELYNNLKVAEKQVAKPTSTLVGLNKLREEALQILAKQRAEQLLARSLPAFKKKGLPHYKKKLIPMQHALNFDGSSEDDENDDDDVSSRSMTPVSKRSRSPSASALDKSQINVKNGDESDVDRAMKKQKTALALNSMYSDFSNDEDVNDENEAVFNEDKMLVDETQPSASSKSDAQPMPSDQRYLPTSGKPSTVYPEQGTLTTHNLAWLKNIIKDDEDFKIANQIFADLNVAQSPIANVGYWAWKRMQANVIGQDTAINTSDPVDDRLECVGGSFKSEGYRKFPDTDKIQFIPHRRQLHKPIKTVQYDDDVEAQFSPPVLGAPNHAASMDQNNSGSSNNASTNGVATSNSTNPAPSHSSRVNRANNRRFAADITAQLGTETEVLSLNTLTKRKKQVSFARSAIHNWGLYALEPIQAREMIIEYVGESIRQQVAEHRERSYLKTGIGSSYLFRIDENTVVDATKKGGIARFINHCCDPSCTAKIIKVGNTKRIVIYALRDIDANEELTYDYKFERETNDEERIKCLCGAATCKGYLN